jgi:glycosyltransferase involved in cell wall biosynthesis
MMHLFVNGLAASAGGGLTYLRNVIPHLIATPGVSLTLALNGGLRPEFPNLKLVELKAGAARRFWYEQSALPDVIQSSGADVLLSTGNFALRSSPVPQILLSRNSIYTSGDFYRDLLDRHEYQMWLETQLQGWLAKQSIRWADATVAPSEAFAAELHRWTGREILTIHHGFDAEAFTRDTTPLSAEVQDHLEKANDSLKLLFVSHYNYYSNFETLFRALPLLRDCFPGRPVKLLLTCKLAAGENPGAYRAARAAKLVTDLGVSDLVIELGAIPYRQLHQVYRRADVYVTPAYTETFAHPLVEAMACGLAERQPRIFLDFRRKRWRSVSSSWRTRPQPRAD